ncbi:unnamed protein product [Allacma fusca]|uniref:Uncharacterized protein n=1 Tax=Allacma fusca TaxID=39272 RepID=A0A8J2KPX0_9HEXA|nr:unnamed protein product [Allacma fusca]
MEVEPFSSNSHLNKQADKPIYDSRKEYTKLLNIPKDIIFPLELSIHLKERLHTALEEIFRLKKQLFNQDYEVNCLDLRDEIRKSDKYFEQKGELKMANPQMATKVVELSKKLRDMTADQESMKSRMKQIMSENESLKGKLNNLDQQKSQQEDSEKNKKSEEELLSTSQQLANTTNKMMDYRRQSQQLRIELRTALKALCQEVGEGTTPQGVLSTVASASWRGRQQQILGLQQKVLELQSKLNQCNQNPPNLALAGAGEPCQEGFSNCCSEAPDAHDDVRSVKSTISNSTLVSSTSTQRRLQGLHQQERNKHEQLEKTNQQLENVKKDLKSALLSLKASKARIETLEVQVRSYRGQIEVLEGKLGGKQVEIQDLLNESTRLNQELDIVKDRMRIVRDTTCSEVRDTNKALAHEKSHSSQLQKVVNDYEKKIDKLNEEVGSLQMNLVAYENAPKDELEARKRLQYLESQFEEMKEGLKASENETRRLLTLMEDSVGRTEEERNSHCNTQRHLIKSFAVIDHAENVINLCLDKGHISDKKVLETIEDLRSMRRELKTGDLYHLEPINVTDVRKLRSRISILSKEIQVLQNNLKASAGERKKDLQNFSTMIEKTRHEFFTAISNSVLAKQLGQRFNPKPSLESS